MATQRVIIAKVAGAAGDALFRRFRKGPKQNASSASEPNTKGRTRAPTDHDLQEFVDHLRRDACQPPVVFYAEYADTWSMGDVFARPFRMRRHVARVDANNLEITVYRLPDGGRLEQFVRLMLRRKHLRERRPQEDRWFYTILLEALLSWESLVEDSVLLLVRDLVGGLLLDEEIERAAQQIPEWVVGDRRGARRAGQDRSSISKRRQKN
jgi:hypothetical protein